MAGLLGLNPLDDKGLGDIPSSAFDAARISRRDTNFLPTGLGPNAESEQGGGLERIWARSSWLYDNHPLVDASAEADIDRVVGTGIDDLEPETGWDDIDEQIAAVFEFAFQAADPERACSAADIQALYWRERRRTGECGVRIVMAEAWAGYPMMPAVELLEAERIPPTLTGINPITKNRVRQGVEYDDQWRVVAYHVLVANPRDGDPRFGSFAGFPGIFGGVSFGSPNLVPIPASEMALCMQKRRIRQLRGVPGLVSGMGMIRTAEEFLRSQMDHAQTAGSVGIIFESTDAGMFKGNSLLVDGAGNPITSLTGLSVAFKKPGTGLPSTAHLNLPGPQLAPTKEVLDREISRALNAPYSQLTGNYSTETFASNRANRIDQRQRDLRNQHLGIWRPLMRPYCRALVQWGVLSGRVILKAEHIAALRVNPEILYRTNVPAPGEAYVNPAQEAGAVETDLGSNVTSEIDVIGRRGGGWKRIPKQRAKFYKLLFEEWKKAGLPGYPPIGGVATTDQIAQDQTSGSTGGDGGQGGGSGDKSKPPAKKAEFASEEEELAAELAACSGDGGIDDGVGRRRRLGLNGTANGVRHE